MAFPTGCPALHRRLVALAMPVRDLDTSFNRSTGALRVWVGREHRKAERGGGFGIDLPFDHERIEDEAYLDEIAAEVERVVWEQSL